MFPTCDVTMINNRNEKKKPQSVGETIQCQNEKGQQWTTKRQNENIFATRTLQKSGGYHDRMVVEIKSTYTIITYHMYYTTMHSMLNCR